MTTVSLSGDTYEEHSGFLFLDAEVVGDLVSFMSSLQNLRQTLSKTAVYILFFVLNFGCI